MAKFKTLDRGSGTEQKVADTYELKQLMRRLEETRTERLAKRREGLEFPSMSLVEKENRLRTYISSTLTFTLWSKFQDSTGQALPIKKGSKKLGR